MGLCLPGTRGCLLGAAGCCTVAFGEKYDSVEMEEGPLPVRPPDLAAFRQESLQPSQEQAARNWSPPGSSLHLEPALVPRAAADRHPVTLLLQCTTPSGRARMECSWYSVQLTSKEEMRVEYVQQFLAHVSSAGIMPWLARR